MNALRLRLAILSISFLSLSVGALSQAPVLTSMSPTALAPGMQVTLTGSSFGSTAGAVGYVDLPYWGAPSIVSWSDTQIVFTVPPQFLPGNLYVSQNGVNSNTLSYTVVPPVLTSMSPTALAPGMQVTLMGSGFGSAAGGQGYVGLPYWGNVSIVSWSDTQIVFTVPPQFLPGNIYVTQNGVNSNALSYTVVPPVLTSMSPTALAPGMQVTLTGSGFGSAAGGQGYVGIPYWGNASIVSWSDTQIVFTVPPQLVAGNLAVTQNGVNSNTLSYTVVPPNVTSMSPTALAPGMHVTLTGSGFGSTAGGLGAVELPLQNAPIVSWSDTQIVFTVPSGTLAGTLYVTQNNVFSNGVAFTAATSLSPLNVSRYQHSATLLNNGMVLIAGGAICPTVGSCSYLSSAELYNPASGISASTGSLATPRVAPAVLLASGKVLIAGGSTCDPYGNCYSLNSAEIYDPASGSFTSAGNLQVARDGHAMTVLSDGRVLISGGESCIPGQGSGGGGPSSKNFGEPVVAGGRLIYASFTPVPNSVSCTAQASAEIYDPQTGVFNVTGSLNTARYNAAATRLANGLVLVVGGSDESNPLTSAELYDPTTAVFTMVAGVLGTARSSPVATLLNSGLVLISGGSTCETPTCPTNTAELYDPTANVFRSTSSNMNAPRVDHSATLLTNGEVLLAGGTTGCSGNTCASDGTTELYDPTAGSFTSSQTLSAARSAHTATLVPDGTVLLTGGIASGTTLASVESYQPASLAPSGLVSIAVAPSAASLSIGGVQQFVATGTFSDGSTSTLQAASWNSASPGVAVVNDATGSSGLALGVSLGSTTITATVGTLSGSATLAVQPPVQSSAFATVSGQFSAPLYAHTATRLTSGQVLVTGGMSSSGVLPTAQIYNPVNQTFSATGAMNASRWLHTATLLNDGTVLIAGGSDLLNKETLDTAEIYNPATGIFTLLPNTLNTARVGHTATLLGNGQVLIIGGYDPQFGLIADAELYDPLTQSFIDLGNTLVPRFGHTATALQNGQVLIAGGETDPVGSSAYNTAELFDLVTQTFTPVSVPMTVSREGHAAVLLNSGQVLIAGGNDPGNGPLNTAELYDPTSDIFLPVTGTMTTGRISPIVTLLNGGQVLIVGGAAGANGPVFASTEIYSPASQLFTAVGNMATVREYQTDTLLNDGTVFIAGGTDGTSIFGTAELYTASQLNGLTSISITPADATIGMGGQQFFTAIGTFTNGSTESLASVLWSSSNPGVATVSNDATNSGAAATLAQGNATVTATAQGVDGSSNLTITCPTLVSIQLSPQSPTVPVGTTQQFTATGIYTDGSTQDLTSSASWSSSTSVVATITNGGLAAGLFQGVSTIQVSFGSVNTTTNLNVGSPGLVSLSVTPASGTIAVGATEQYQAVGTYSDGSTQNLTGVVGWSSSTLSVASISAAGLALGASQGATTITATLEAISTSAPMTVGPPNLVSLSISPNLTSLSLGTSQQLSATGTYSDGSTQNLTSSSSWTSSNSGILAVSNSGLATTGGIGQVTITATSGSSSGTATLFVTSGTGQANLNTSRYQHNSTTLNSGQVLVAGGIHCPSSGSCTYLNSAELYDPNTASFVNTGVMATARSAPSVLLNNGKVLIAGGYTCDSSGNCSSLSSVETYNPSTGTFSSAGNMTVARSGHTVSLLPNGTVLIAGGENCTSATSCSVLSSAEVYDPIAGTFTATPNNMNSARFGASAILLDEGIVLIIGGSDGTNVLPGTEAYISTGFVAGSGGPSLNVARMNATATLLNNGGVLVAGGSTCLTGCPTNSAELITITPTAISLGQSSSGLVPQIKVGFVPVSGGMNIPRFNHTATLLTNGTVLIAGGDSSCASSCTEEASTEVFDPTAGTFTVTQALGTATAGQTATLANNGDVLFIGGIDAGATLASDQWYQSTSPTPNGLVSVAISPANSSVASGLSTKFAATGTFNDGSTKTLESVVWNSSDPSVVTVSNSPGNIGTVTAKNLGTVTLTASAGGVTGSTTVGVKSLASLTISPANPYIVPVYLPGQLAAVATFSDGSTQDVTNSASWTSSNNSVVLLGPISEFQGYIAATTVGTATVTATLGNVQASTLVTATTNLPPPVVPSISTVLPTSGQAGTQVTITGTGFGSSPGTNGSVLLGSAVGTIVSWSDTQIVAIVSPIAQSGFVQVVQIDGNSSNTVPFSVNTATITNVSPTTGMAGTQVTVTGSGFGATQGGGIVWLGTSPAAIVSWSDTQIVASVSPVARSGNALVQQNGQSSNSVPFNINTATISNVSPPNGLPGNSITISGSGFGTSQGSGLVWLGTVPATVQNWTDTQIVAIVASGATSGSARVLQNGIMSNAVPFSVSSLQISSISPNSGAPGIVVTINGNGFGNSQGNGVVRLGSTNGEVVAWSNTQILAAVASNAVSGVARVQQNGAWSDALTFTVPVQGGGGQSATLTPNMLNLVVGQTQAIQALDANSQPVTGLTWTSSDPLAVSLSTSDPPVLTALTPGHVTITAGNSSADVMVYNGSLPIGTVLWSDPGDGSGVVSIVPAVPSATGVADVFALNGDCNVQAIESDGTVAWKANIGSLPAQFYPFNAGQCNQFVPDFQGGIEVVRGSGYVNEFGYPIQQMQVQKLDGVTGQAYPQSDPIALNGQLSGTSNSSNSPFPQIVTHPDGTIFTARGFLLSGGKMVAGSLGGPIDPTTGQTIPVNVSDVFPMDARLGLASAAPGPDGSFPPDSLNYPIQTGNWIIAGDGYAYLPYTYMGWSGFQPPGIVVTLNPITGQLGWVPACGTLSSDLGGVNNSWFAASSYTGAVYLTLLRIDTSGNGTTIPLGSWNVAFSCGGVPFNPTFSGTGATVQNVTLITNADQGVLASWQVVSTVTNNGVSGPQTTTNYVAATVGTSLVSQNMTASLLTPVLQAQDGTFFGNGDQGMARFDQTGNIKWSVGDSPKVATADNGVVGASGMTYDSNGNATGQIANPNYSWTQNTYQIGSIDKTLTIPPAQATPPYWSNTQANPSSNSTSPLCHDGRDQIVAQYGQYRVGDAYFPPLPGTNPVLYPRYTPNCRNFAIPPSDPNTIYTPAPANFKFADLNTNSGGAYPLIKSPLVVPPSTGYGLAKWVATYNDSRTINSAYRTPEHNANLKPNPGRPGSRHMFGDAVDLRNAKCPSGACTSQDGIQEWIQMVIAAGGIVNALDEKTVPLINTGAKASFIEPKSGPCALNCTHADWRMMDRGKYAH